MASRVSALPELEAPSGQELEDFSAIGGETLEELRKLLKVSDSVNMDAKNLHLNICCGRYEQSKMKKDLEHSCEQKAEEIATRESVDAVLTFALAGCGVLTLFPLILYGATVTAVGATAAGCVGGVASFKFKRVQKHKISQAEAELNEKRKDAAKAEKSVVAYTQLDFFADPFSKGLVELEGHLRVLEGILDELLKCVNTEFRLAKTLRKKLDEELAYLPLRS
ncbi:unnamed protein product [Closterium sp. NIES-64]|nr:unnamed protein product [Closterium sp. NIES-64]